MEGVGRSRSGLFVVIEGIDGAGTTTQADRCAAHLRARGRRVHVTREPSAGPVGSLIRLVLTHRLSVREAHRAQVMALLFAADRLDHVDHEITPELALGGVVISDRYDLSSLAYQSISAAVDPGERAAMTDFIRACNRYARRPDLTVVLDVSPAVAAERRRTRGEARDLFDDADLQARLADVYRRAEDLVPGDRVAHVDGDRDVHAVTAAITSALDLLAEAPDGAAL